MKIKLEIEEQLPKELDIDAVSKYLNDIFTQTGRTNGRTINMWVGQASLGYWEEMLRTEINRIYGITQQNIEETGR